MGAIIDIFSAYRFLFSLLILALLLIVGRLCHVFLEHWLKKIVGKTKTKLDDEILDMLGRPIYWSVILIGIYVAILALQLDSQKLVLFGNGLLTIGLLIWGVVSTRIFRVIFAEIEHKVEPGHEGIVSDFIPFLEGLIKVFIVGVVIFVILNIWGIDITPLFLSAGVAGVAVAFAARDTVANLFGGLSVFIDRPYKIGDYVIVNEKYRGEVIEIGMRSTKIRTRDNVLLTIPNSVLVTNTVINETGFDPKLRIRIPLSVAYDSDLEKVEKILIDTIAQHKEILKNPKPKVRFRKFDDSAIKLEVLGVINKPVNRGRVIHELIKSIDKRFKKEHISLPYPQMDVHLYGQK